MDSSRMAVYLTLAAVVNLYFSANCCKAEETRNEYLSTRWFKTPPIGIYNEKINGIVKMKVKDMFNDPDMSVRKDITKDKSPSMELAFGDTGDNSYLDKKTLKHSVSELATLTKVNRINPDKTPSCQAIQEGPKLFFSSCPGDVVVITIAGSMKMTCNEIEKRVFYGPVTIKTSTCQQSFVFDRDCGELRALHITNSSCKTDGGKQILISFLILMIIIIIFLLLSILWLHGISKGIRVGDKYGKMTRKGCYYYCPYNEYINGDGKKEYQLDGEESKINMETKTIKKHFLILLLLFTMCKAPSIKAYELMESYDSTILKYNYKIIMGDNEGINLGFGEIKREPVYHTSNLVHLFETSSWELDTREEYFCQWYKCEALSVCGMQTLPFIKVGNLAQSLFNFKNKDLAYYTCQKLTGYCTFGNGCKLIAFEINALGDDTYTVYTISIGGSHGGDVSPPTGCVIDSIIDKSSGFIKDYLLVTNRLNKHYLCSRDLFSAKPELGMLGDIQRTTENTTHFATNEISCVADHNNRAICRYSEPFISKLDVLCESMNSLPFEVKVDLNDKILSWKQSGEAIVSMRCDRRLPVTSSIGTCKNIELRVWEVSHLDSQLLMGFKAISENKESSFKFPKAIHMSNHLFTCNGIQQFSELYDLKSLKISGLNYTMESIPYKSLDDLQKDHFSNLDPETGRGVSIFDQVVKSTPILSLGAIIIILLVVFLFICLCRH